MDDPKQQAQPAPVSGEAPHGISPSEAWKLGRRLQLEFLGGEVPVLHKISFTLKNGDDPMFFEQGTLKNDFKWSEVPKVLSLILLEYLIWDKSNRPEPRFRFSGKYKDSPAACLGTAVYGANNVVRDLFIEINGKGETRYLAPMIFTGENVHGRDKDHKDRLITINLIYLPPDCIKVIWDSKGTDGLKALDDFICLADRIWQQLGMKKERPVPKPVQRSPETPPPLPGSVPTGNTEPKPSVEKEAFSLSTWLATEFQQALNTLRGGRSRSKPSGPAKKKVAKAEDQSQASAAYTARPQKGPETPLPKAPAAKIDPRLFQIQNPGQEEWDDFEGLVNFGDEDSEADIWRIRDASEGLAVFGAVGSGKTSSTGSLIATEFLKTGYGGLVLTAKPDEAKRWLRLCERTGRMEDCIHVTPQSGHQLNILQYETQRPGNRINVTEDLIGLFRCIIGVISRSKQSGVKDDFWSVATDQLMRNLFEVFLLSDEPLTVDRLVHFINQAPQQPTNAWQNLEYFGDILTRAKQKADDGTDTDKEAFFNVFNYWTNGFPKVPGETRGGFVTGFCAMASILNGRGIKEILCGETNLTPEMLLSGKIAIMDFPLKESAQGGNMVQATWKLLFQQAIERRADKGLKTARPVFLWADESHYFFSQYDVNFQPTARDCRASHVMISQNLHNFLHLGHNPHAVAAVFAAMNSYIFHTNGDQDLNRWASERIGNIREKRLSTSGLFLGHVPDEDYSLFPRRPEDVKSIGQFTIVDKNEPALPPEEFSKLKRGGDGTCEAVILWLSHQFACNRNRNYCIRTFQQEPR